MRQVTQPSRWAAITMTHESSLTRETAPSNPLRSWVTQVLRFLANLTNRCTAVNRQCELSSPAVSSQQLTNWKKRSSKCSSKTTSFARKSKYWSRSRTPLKKSPRRNPRTLRGTYRKSFWSLKTLLQNSTCARRPNSSVSASRLSRLNKSQKSSTLAGWSASSASRLFSKTSALKLTLWLPLCSRSINRWKQTQTTEKKSGKDFLEERSARQAQY